MGRVRDRSNLAKDLGQTQLAKAIKAYKDKNYASIRATAEALQVPYSTLRGRLNGGRQDRKLAHQKDQTLSATEEKVIVRWITNLDNRGFPPRVDMVTFVAQRILRNRGARPIVGKHWVTRFLDRHPQLTTKFSTQVRKQRILATQPGAINAYFRKLSDIIRKHHIKPCNIYNMDEKGFLMGVAARVKVICVRGRRSPPLMHDGTRETITVLETVAADGSVLPPMIIYKGAAQYRAWHTYLSAKDDDSVFAFSSTGWTNQVLGVEYLKLLFGPATSKRLMDSQDWRLLIVDGHNSYFTNEFIQFCMDRRIELFCLPPHTTHLLQPLDVGLFSPLQHFYSKQIEEFMRNGQETVNKAISQC